MILKNKDQEGEIKTIIVKSLLTIKVYCKIKKKELKTLYTTVEQFESKYKKLMM